MTEIDWSTLRCRHGCDTPVVGLYAAPGGCVCFPDPVQALCAQHAQNNSNMHSIVERDSEENR